MRNIIDSYELDFIKDIPVEFKKIEAQRDSLKESNFWLITVIGFIVFFGSLVAYKNYYDNKKIRSSFNEIDKS